MKSFVIIAIVGLFVAVTFVPPTIANLQSKVGSAVLAQSKEAVLSSTSVDIGEAIGKATAIINGAFGANTGTLDHLQATVTSAGSAQANTVLASAKQQVAQEVSTAVTKKVMRTIRQATGTQQPLVSLRTSLTPTELKMFSAHVEVIESALQSNTVRTCGEIDALHIPAATSDSSVHVPSSADFMVLCVAMVTGDSRRCLQIDASVSSPSLQSICTRYTEL